MLATSFEILQLQAIQLTLLVGAVWLVTKMLTRNHAHLSYVLWLVVLLKCVTPPLWASPTGVFSWMYAEQPVVASLVSTLNELESPRAIPLDAISAATPPTNFDIPGDAANIEPTSDSTVSSSAGAKPRGTSIDVKAWSLLGGWLGVATVIFTFAIWRTAKCTRKVLANRVANSDLDLAAAEIRQTLGLKRHVRVAVTSCRVGPGVIGLFRPTIVLPQAVVEQRSTTELKPILAHELVHVRRGDLWIGLLRHVSQALWWFNPFVWLMGSEVRHGAEKCCDEEVIASLGISPLAYAESLLSVLETKQELRALPLVPGVRPIDVTSQRLERIMKTTNHHRSTPRWCWALAVLVAVVSLPGAGTILGQQRSTDTKKPNVGSPVSVPTEATTNTITAQAVDSDARLTGELVVDDAIKQRAIDAGLSWLAKTNDAEREIERALQTSVTVRFEGTPLSKVLETLTQPAGINVFIENTALSDEGITLDTSVSATLRKPVSLESALNLILHPLNLTHTIENEVLKISGVTDPYHRRRRTTKNPLKSSVSKPVTELAPLNMLRRSPEKIYKLGPGDILGLFIEGILGNREAQPPLNFSDAADGNPSVGFPVPVREDGTLPLPLVDPIKVNGMTLIEAQTAITRAYTVEKELLQKEEARILVSLIRPRRIKVLVFRQDFAPSATVPVPTTRDNTQDSANRRGNEIELPATEADVLSVLAQTGGLPERDAANEILVYRSRENRDDASLLKPVRVPLQVPHGTIPEIDEADITLHDGDIVVVPRRRDA